MHELSDNDNSLTEFSRSFENIDELVFVKELKEERDELRNYLESTEQELESTIIENNQLKRQIQKLIQENKFLKDICKTPPPPSAKKLLPCSETKQKFRKFANLADRHGPIKKPEPIKHISFFEEHIKELQLQLKSAREEIAILIETIYKLELKFQNQNNINRTQKLTTDGEEDNIILKPVQFANSKNKLCILSNNKRHKITLLIQENELFKDFDTCHFITQNATVEILLKDIESNLKNYTKNDYCIIMIGEWNFKSTQNYNELVQFIRKKLQRLHEKTNIVIAAPVYKVGRPIYNGRVESFNRFLSLDMNYGWFFDSNKNLTCDMFDKASGKLNNKGMKNNLFMMDRELNVQTKYLYDTKETLELPEDLSSDESKEKSKEKSNESKEKPNESKEKPKENQFFLS
ncbi:hypothetical protein O0L34_g14730 [Tuta absoluta]|nr:hypothetical protein O0L34_g14730 [Tuta absoluta]